MGDRSRIEWTDATWNPVTGCTKISQGCKHCYAERVWKRLAAPGQPYASRAFTNVAVHPERLEQPLRWRKPRRVFVNSMSDLFHEDVPDTFIDWVFGAMGACDDRQLRHVFQILTKRPARMCDYMRTRAQSAWNMRRIGHKASPPRNVWLGVSVEDQATANERIPLLLETPAAVRWISAEPLLGRVDLCEHLGMWWNQTMGCFEGTGMIINQHPDGRPSIGWVVVGGESGPGARPMNPSWVRSLRNQCQGSGAAFFFKQWGEWAPNCVCGRKDACRETARPEPGPRGVMFRCGKSGAGRELDGRTWDEYPGEAG